MSPNSHRSPDSRHASFPLPLTLLAVVIPTVVGCGPSSDLNGRVAINVSVTIGDQPAGNGSLVLRPEPGVKCPLIRIPVINGVGNLPAAKGPVPGEYVARFRPAEVAADISARLSKSGRVAPQPPSSAKPVTVTGDDGEPIVVPKGTIELTVPDSNPATVEARFDAK